MEEVGEMWSEDEEASASASLPLLPPVPSLSSITKKPGRMGK